jgi:SanA protein
MRFSAFHVLLGGPWQRVRTILVLILMGDLLWTFVKFPAGSRSHIIQSANLPVMQALVLILGAGVLPDREPSQVLEERLRTALDLYLAGKVRWFLVSGDNRSQSYNEPQAMRRWLLKQGVPPQAIISDYAGRRTYDSLKRIKMVFGVQRIVVVTSDFHLPRALFLARHLGLEAWGVPAPTGNQSLGTRLGFWGREYIARHKALLDVWFPPDTLLGPREPTPDDWQEEKHEVQP